MRALYKILVLMGEKSVSIHSSIQLEQIPDETNRIEVLWFICTTKKVHKCVNNSYCVCPLNEFTLVKKGPGKHLLINEHSYR